MTIDLGKYREWLKILALAEIPVDLRGEIDPSDIVQQTLYEALRDLPKHRGKTECELMGWLRSVLKFNLIDAYRARKKARKVPLEESLERTDDGMSRFMANLTSVDVRAMRHEEALLLADLLRQLSPAQAEALVLKHCQGMSVDQICRHMNRSPAAVGGLLRHGMNKLRKLLPRED